MNSTSFPSVRRRVAAERAAEDPQGLGPSIWVAAELIEAAVRSGQVERAMSPLAQLLE